MRTFSKAYGMAGVRVGYGIGAARLIRAFDKVRNHFGVEPDRAGGRASPRSAIRPGSRESSPRSPRRATRIGEIARGERPAPAALGHEFRRHRLRARRRLRPARAAGADGARHVRAHALVAPQDRCIRVSAGTDADLAVFAEDLPGALAAAADSQS